jgi:hypothetical protein
MFRFQENPDIETVPNVSEFLGNNFNIWDGRAIAQAASHWLLTAAAAGFIPWSSHVEFVVYKVALGQVFSEYLGFPCQS